VILVKGDRAKIGQFVKAKIVDWCDYDLIGEEI